MKRMISSVRSDTFILSLFVLLISLDQIFAQQKPDTSYYYQINQCAYFSGKGPLILIDEAHSNFHTKDGGFFAFSKLLEQDGYQVKGLKEPLSEADLLRDCKLLVIANPLHTSNRDNWILPNPSAFTTKEIGVIEQWVKNGGRLLLIADHMPFAGAAGDLGKAFGFTFVNGFAFTGENSWPPSVFSTENGTLKKTPVTNGLNAREEISSVSTFTGSAFKSPEGSINILCFSPEHYALIPDTAWVFSNKTQRLKLDGFCQGAVLNHGKGKVAVFGEAAMFTAQIVNGNMKVGFNSEDAQQNAQFILNLIHWLDGLNEY